MTCLFFFLSQNIMPSASSESDLEYATRCVPARAAAPVMFAAPCHGGCNEAALVVSGIEGPLSNDGPLSQTVVLSTRDDVQLNNMPISRYQLA
jgi:hypothetical protein